MSRTLCGIVRAPLETERTHVTDAAAVTSLTTAVTEFAAGDGVVAAGFFGATPVFALAQGEVAIGLGETATRVAAHKDAALLCAAFDGRRLITGGDDGRVVATDVEGGATLLAEARGKWIDAIAAREDGAIAFTAGRAAFACSPKGELKTVALPSASRGLAFLPKGYRLAVAHYNGVSLWFPGTGAAPEVLEWKGSHLDATVSPDGKYVVTSMQENMLHGWRLSDGRNLRMAGYPAKTRSFSWSQDGKWLATSGADACILWPFTGKDGPMGQQPRECGVRSNVLVTQVACHPKAPVVAVGYQDGMILLCRVADGSEILVRRPSESGEQARVSALRWDEKSVRLAFGCDDGAAGVLTLPAAG
jgi:WD40 repeat protein